MCHCVLLEVRAIIMSVASRGFNSKATVQALDRFTTSSLTVLSCHNSVSKIEKATKILIRWILCNYWIIDLVKKASIAIFYGLEPLVFNTH